MCKNSTCAVQTCFDETYPCEMCCTTGKSVQGGSCWDTTYTIDRRCNNQPFSPSLPSPPAYSPPTSSIVALAQATPSLSGLVSALTLQSQRPVLDYLMGPGPFTVFAPTNTAFEALKKLRNPQGISLYDFVMGPGRDVLVSIMCHWP